MKLTSNDVAIVFNYKVQKWTISPVQSTKTNKFKSKSFFECKNVLFKAQNLTKQNETF